MRGGESLARRIFNYVGYEIGPAGSLHLPIACRVYADFRALAKAYGAAVFEFARGFNSFPFFSLIHAETGSGKLRGMLYCPR
jgi:hypothetical protein